MDISRTNTEGLYWTPFGGNNAKDIWSSCHCFASVSKDEKSGKVNKDVILVDLGQHETPAEFTKGAFDTVVPALDGVLKVPLFETPAPENTAKAVFLTHSHSDHINGIYEYVRMGVKLPPIYASEFTINMIKKGFVEKDIDWNLIPEFRPIKAGDVIKVGDATVEAFQASHSIPGAFSYKISNKHASIFHSGDVKADPSSFLKEPMSFEHLGSVGANGGVDMMTFDATATDREGHARHESEICDTYTELFSAHADKQLIAPISAGHMERLATVIAAAERVGKDVIINGGSSMQSHIMGLSASGLRLEEIFPKIKVLSYKNPETEKLDLKNTVTITTGIYGDKKAPFIKALREQSVIFPLQEDAVVIAPLVGDKYERLEKIISKSPVAKNMTFITAIDRPDLYGSGHAQQDDFKLIASQVKPRIVVPIHCSQKMANALNRLAKSEKYQTFTRQIHNGETVFVSAERGASLVGYKQPQWFGLTHKKDKFGDTKTSFAKIMDNGFSASSRTPAETTPKKAQRSFESKRSEADRKIAEYKAQKTPLITKILKTVGRKIHDR